MEPSVLLEALLELAARAELEVRLLPGSASSGDFQPAESAACRAGDRIWVILAPNDPAAHHARVLAEALGRFRAPFLDDTFIAPGVREFIDQICGK
jgi:hypothetical protein